MQNAMKQWQRDTRDPLTDPKKLWMLVKENDAVVREGRRSPAEGWQYLDYLQPDRPMVGPPEKPERVTETGE